MRGKKIFKSAMQKANARKGIVLTLLTPSLLLASKSRVAFTIVAAMSLALVMSEIVKNTILRTRADGPSSF
jgi:hypothetical protein